MGPARPVRSRCIVCRCRVCRPDRCLCCVYPVCSMLYLCGSCVVCVSQRARTGSSMRLRTTCEQRSTASTANSRILPDALDEIRYPARPVRAQCPRQRDTLATLHGTHARRTAMLAWPHTARDKHTCPHASSTHRSHCDGHARRTLWHSSTPTTQSEEGARHDGSLSQHTSNPASLHASSRGTPPVPHRTTSHTSQHRTMHARTTQTPPPRRHRLFCRPSPAKLDDSPRLPTSICPAWCSSLASSGGGRHTQRGSWLGAARSRAGGGRPPSGSRGNVLADRARDIRHDGGDLCVVRMLQHAPR